MSAICPRFVQNAWKKDLCSNCFKSREEHQNAQAHQKRSIPVVNTKAEPPKSIMKSNEKNGTPKRNVSFPKELSEVIGIGGGDFSDIDDNDDYDNDYTDSGINFTKSEDYEETPDPELIRITKHNTDFNMNPSNLAITETKNESSIKKNLKSTFQALKLGVNHNKEPLQITVLPFGQKTASTQKVTDMKQLFTTTNTTKLHVNMTNGNSESIDNDTSKSTPTPPPVCPEKTLLEEISETLEKNKKNETAMNLLNENLNSTPPTVVTSSSTVILETNQTSPVNRPNRSLTRNNPIIKKDQQKPKITIFTKTDNDNSDISSSSSSDASTNSSDQESSTSAYYDVVTNDNYENLDAEKPNANEKSNTSFFSSQLISDMFLSKKPISDHLRKRSSEVYNLSDRSYITSKITSDGLIVTHKSNSNNGLDYDEDDEDHDEHSSGSSFDTSSDEEMSSMNNRSESDSGIGICVTTSNNYQNVSDTIICNEKPDGLKKSVSSDYEDIQIEKTTSRELAGEPDGRSDPDGSAEAVPALPNSPPPNIDARKSFLHGLQKSIAEKPKVPAKPTVSVIKTFAKRGTTNSPNQVAQQQVILQLQQVMNKSGVPGEEEKSSTSTDDNLKTFKKGRAPNPPTPPSTSPPSSAPSTPPATPVKAEAVLIVDKPVEILKVQTPEIESQPTETETDAITIPPPQISSLYQRNPNLSIKSNSPVVREKDKRERATINPKFRSFNPSANQSNRQSFPDNLRSTTPEPAPRKSLSISQDSLNNLDIDKKKKTKFSIKKFLNIGNSNKNNVVGINNNGTSVNAIQIQNKFETTNDQSQQNSSTPLLFDSGLNSVQNAKPRLVIIHPLDMNNSGVEVIKSSEISTTPTTPIVQSPLQPPTTPTSTMPSSIIGKPPAPPIRTTGMDGTRIAGQEVSKPARPPPPKSAELRRKQKLAVSSAAVEKKELELGLKDGNLKPDNVYANLGEIRSSIAPRKPERTASMRGEKDTIYDVTSSRCRPIGQYENITPGSFASDSGDNNSSHDEQKFDDHINTGSTASIQLSRHASDASDFSTSTDSSSPVHTPAEITRLSVNQLANNSNNFIERKKKLIDLEKTVDQSTIRSTTSTNSAKSTVSTTSLSLNDGIKSSVQKMSTTIDSYLKDKKLNSFNSGYGQHQQNTSPMSCSPDDIEIRSNCGYDAIIGGGQPGRSSFTDSCNAAPTIQNNAVNNGSMVDKLDYRKSDQVVDIYSKKFNQGNLPRAISMSYCGSEIGGGGSICGESEIYSPYSYSASEAGNDVAMGDPQDGWMGANGSFTSHGNMTKMRSGKIINRLRMRKGRSVVHKNLEDNYGAVIVANHEALAQVLDQLQQTPYVPIHLRPIANSINLRFDDFSLAEGARGMVVGRRAFHSAMWQANHIQVTLALTADCNQISGVGGDLNQMSGGICGALNPITEFCDLVPSNYLPLMPSTQIRMIQTTISVLPRMHIDTIQSLGSILKSRSNPAATSSMALCSSFGGSIPNLANIKEQQMINSSSKVMSYIRNGSSVQNLTTINDDSTSTITGSVLSLGNTMNNDEILTREVGFVMLQLINGLKNLQAKGIEEMPLSLSNVILCREVENKESQARLCVLQSLNLDSARDDEEPIGTLCQCSNTALTTMLPPIKFTNLLSSILTQEKSDSLSKTKSILEYIIWGPSDVQLTGTLKERELALQRWLDLERATVLHGLVRTRVELTVYDECHLMFLVRSNAKIMSEASSILMANE